MGHKFWVYASVMSDRRAIRLVCLFMACLLLVGLLTGADYGQPWDEPDEMNILRMNLWEYANALGLDDTAFTQMATSKDAATPPSLLEELSPISQSIERDHGESAYYPLAGVVMSELSPAEQSAIWHAYTWFLFWLGAVALYFVCRHLKLSRGLSCAAVLMLMLSPRFFAEGHYNNKDIVLMAFVLLTLWQSLRLGEKPSVCAGLSFALVGAVAANTKIIGLFVFGLCGIFVLCRLLAAKRLDKKAGWVGVCTLLSFSAFYALLTPALWKAPLDFLRYVLQNAAGFTRWEGYVLFRGMVFDTAHQPLPWYYLPYMMLVTTPLWIWLLFGAGQTMAFAHLLRRGEQIRALRFPLLLCTLLWLVPLGFALLSHTAVYNGWRHFYFLYGPMLALAAYGLAWVWEHVKTVRWKRYLAVVLLALSMTLSGVNMAMNHPYQYVYYNALAPNVQINPYLERDYWNVSVAGALTELRQTEAYRSLEPPVHSSFRPPILVRGVDLWSQFGVESALATVQNLGFFYAADVQDDNPHFWLVNHTYQNYSHWKPSPDMVPVVQISAYGEPLVTIYQNPTIPKEDAL